MVHINNLTPALSTTNKQVIEDITKQVTVGGALGNAKVIEREFDPTMIDFYTGRAMKFEKYTVEDIEPDVYVHGLDAHSGHAFTIYSKVKKGTTQTVNLQLDGEVLKIYVQEDQVNNNNQAEQHKVLQILLSEKPTHFEVYKNGSRVKREEILYSIE